MHWLLLIHQIPAKPPYFRAKILRRLQQLGAVAIKQSVYALPERESTREDFTWLAKEISEGGGEAVLLAASMEHGLEDHDVTALFQEARRADYSRIHAEASCVLEQWREHGDGPVNLVEQRSQLARLRKACAQVAAIDFFPVEEGARTEAVLADLETMLKQQMNPRAREEESPRRLASGMTWVTREHVYADRMACGWLIKRFIDPQAQFVFVSGPNHQPGPNELRYDMTEAEYTHEGEECTFEVMLHRFGLNDPALARIARIIHDIDLKEQIPALPETSGVQAMLDGIVATTREDSERFSRAGILLDTLLAHFQTTT